MLHEDRIIEYYEKNGRSKTIQWVNHYGYTKKEAINIVSRVIDNRPQKPF